MNKPGGNFVKPIIEDGSNKKEYAVIVRWREVDRYDNDSEAVNALKRIVGFDPSLPTCFEIC